MHRLASLDRTTLPDGTVVSAYLGPCGQEWDPQEGAECLGRIAVSNREHRWRAMHAFAGRIEGGRVVPWSLAHESEARLRRLAHTIDIDAGEDIHATFARAERALLAHTFVVPVIGLGLDVRYGSWALMFTTVGLLITMRHHLSRLGTNNDFGRDEPWLLLDAEGKSAQAARLVWASAIIGVAGSVSFAHQLLLSHDMLRVARPASLLEFVCALALTIVIFAEAFRLVGVVSALIYARTRSTSLRANVRAYPATLFAGAMLAIVIARSITKEPRRGQTIELNSAIMWQRKDLLGPIWEAVSVGRGSACGLTLDHEWRCWGDPVANPNSEMAIRLGLLPPRSRFSAIDTGMAQCAVDESGRLHCLGSSALSKDIPPKNGFIAIATDIESACGLDQAGDVHCWGKDHGIASAPPVRMRAVDVVHGFACGLDEHSHLLCWGAALKQRGWERLAHQPFAGVSMGESGGCGLSVSGQLECWAWRQDAINSWILKPPSGARFRQVSIGDHSACGVTHENQLLCWPGYDRLSEHPPSGVFESASVGDRSACAVRTDHTLTCWCDRKDEPMCVQLPAAN